MELKPNTVVNLGFSMPDGVASVASKVYLDQFTYSIEQGIVGGMPASGAIFGVAYNPQAIINAPSIFDFYSGRGPDIICLVFVDAKKKCQRQASSVLLIALDQAVSSIFLNRPRPWFLEYLQRPAV